MPLDLRFALRQLRKSPGFAAAAILTLALGIGANTALFSLLEADVLRPLPYPAAGRLVQVWQTNPRHPLLRAPLDRRDAAAVLAAAPTIETAALDQGGEAVWRVGGEPVQLGTDRVSKNFFSLLGVRIARGRGFAPADFAGATRVAIIGDTLWRERFGGRDAALGAAIALGAADYTVVGVAPAGFSFAWGPPGFGTPTDVWLPLTAAPAPFPNADVGLLARLRPGARHQLAAQLAAVAARLARHDPDWRGWGLTAVSLDTELRGAVRPALWLLWLATGLVLLIALANVANLLLERGWRRGGELGLRAALGAGRARLIRQLCLEGVLLALPGGALGLLLAWWLARALRLVAPAGWLPHGAPPHLLPTALFAAAIALLVGILAGLPPAALAARLDPNVFLRGAAPGAGGGGRRGGHVLVVAEVALALVLASSSLLLLRSFANWADVPLGLDTSHVLTTSLWPGAQLPAAARSAFLARTLAAIRAVPGITAVAADSAPLLAGMTYLDFPVHANGRVVTGWRHRTITANYFRVLGIPLLRGRVFTAADTAGAPPVVIVNRSFARRGWGPATRSGTRSLFGTAARLIPFA